MITPEVQNYINQSRAAGMTNDQIRQTLAAQGWQQSDLDQAFGSTAASTSSAGNHGKVIGIVLGIIILLLLVFGVVGYGFYNKFKQSKTNVSQNTNTPYGSNNNNKAPDPVCKESTKSLPAGYPQDVPVYPGSKLTSIVISQYESKESYILLYCSNESDASKIAAYYESNTSWPLTNPYANSALDVYNQDDRKLLAGEKSGYMLAVSIMVEKTETIITYQLTAK